MTMMMLTINKCHRPPQSGGLMSTTTGCNTNTIVIVVVAGVVTFVSAIPRDVSNMSNTTSHTRNALLALVFRTQAALEPASRHAAGTNVSHDYDKRARFRRQ